ncbi:MULTISPECIES: DUF3828 domain-containing protein [Citrobacter]|uniref:DUF3828 domain-containing protein n=1 Tax=Citrobacter TaxID=544 RepID=UPI0008DDA11C|nr:MULTISPECIES: DUF3828 domain-containing protein [Citrobacter]MBE0024538.1 DUF3828 domain-containing protein [Citrobacter koseri]MBE0083633.1 DUF3828 domain-containing protein [Citrobacter koseri]MBJ8812426.1 DUF3828 domain-containing protein [Citrobacter koseri]MBJ9347041.1 DUF3828 domain-containing protein [Citrobacter koseri]MDM2963062.1 YbjP/YqhG family protein [Citrobacter sp. CK201]
MKELLKLLILLSISFATFGAIDDKTPISRALEFNKWYINQINKDIYPISAGHEIDNFVTSDTMKKLRHAQDPKYADDEFYDADFFIKAQYIGDDWPTNVTVVSSDYDPVCVNVYVSFGKKRDHIVVDCMVREGGRWRVQSVVGHEIYHNSNLQ